MTDHRVAPSARSCRRYRARLPRDGGHDARSCLDAQGLATGNGGRAGREVLAGVRGLGQATLRPDVSWDE